MDNMLTAESLLYNRSHTTSFFQIPIHELFPIVQKNCVKDNVCNPASTAAEEVNNALHLVMLIIYCLKK